MTEPARRARPPASPPGLVTGAALSFVTSAAFFVLAAALVPLRQHLVLVVLWGIVYAVAVIVAARRWGPLFGVPMAIAAGLAFDSFYIPPTRPFGESTWQNWLVIAIYLGFGSVVGALAARSQRTAEASERARGALADEQAALRRVATLVAQQQPPDDVFLAVTTELGRLLGVDDVRLVRFEPDTTASIVARWGISSATGREPGVPRSAADAVAAVQATRAAQRTGAAPDGLTSLATPVLVDGRLWGAAVCTSARAAALAGEAETRVGEFTELAATAIANVEAHTALAASRARITAASDAERRRVVRDLHDGAQQRLVHTVITLKLARRRMPDDDPAADLVDEALDQAQQATAELRELAHGIMPAVLTRGGLRAGIDALASRMPIPVERCVEVDRLPPAVEASAYFAVAEALTNAAKHSAASQVSVRVRLEGPSLRLEVRDDGVGGARADGSGLVGIADRLAALGGRLAVDSPPHGGTTITAWVPTDASP